MIAPAPHLTVLGALGDLAGRQLLPGVVELAARDELPPGFALRGVGREPIGAEAGWEGTPGLVGERPADAFGIDHEWSPNSVVARIASIALVVRLRTVPSLMPSASAVVAMSQSSR